MNKNLIRYLQEQAAKDAEKLLTENDILFIKELIQKDEERRQEEEKKKEGKKSGRKK